MLHAISWGSFEIVLLVFTILYYAAIGGLFFRKDIIKFLRRRKSSLLLTVPGTFGFAISRAQDGNQGISQANTMIRGYYDTAVQLMYAISAIAALGGAIHVFWLWNNGHRGAEVQGAAAAWFGSCVFLVIVATVIRSFFGL